MKKLFIVEDSILNKVTYYYLALFVASLPFDRFYSSLLLIGFIAITLLNIDKKKIPKLLSPQALAVQAIYVVTLLSSIYTSDLKQAMHEWEKQLALLLLPAALAVNAIDLLRYRTRLMWVFSVSCFMTVLYLYGDALSIIRYYHLPPSAIASASFINQHFAEPIGMHATYLSLYISLAFIFLVERIMNERSQWKKLFATAVVLIPVLSTLQLGAKSVTIALLLIALFIVPFFLHAKQRKVFIPFTLIAATIAILFILNADMMKKRYVVDLKKDLYHPVDETTGAEYRLVRWKTAIKLIAKKPFAGYGAGSEIDVLKEQYFKDRLYFSYISSFNAHNQYLSFLLTAGIVGLIVFLAALIYYIGKAWHSRDLLLLSCLVLVALLSLSENILSVNKGIFFVAFFVPFLSFTSPLVAKRTKKKSAAAIFTQAATSKRHTSYQKEDALQTK